LGAFFIEYEKVAGSSREEEQITMSSDAEQKIEAYLTRLSLGLRGLSRDDIREIVEELRGHILERATLDGEVSAAGVQAALANLGNPERLAREYVTDNLLARAEVSVVALANSPQAVSLGQFQFCRFLRFVGGRIRLSARGHAYVVRSIQNDSSPYCRAMGLRP